MVAGNAVMSGVRRDGFQGSKFLFSIVCIISITLISCGIKQNHESGLKHTADQPLRSTEAWQWHDLTDEEFENIFVPFQKQVFENNDLTFLAANDPLTLRAQAWVDKIDLQIRADHPEEMKNVPKPKAVVSNDLAANAYVMPIPVCLSLSMELNPDAADGSSVATALLNANGEMYPGVEPDMCVQKALSKDEAEQFVKWINSQMADCEVSLSQIADDEFRLIPGDACKGHFMLRFYQSADQVVYLPAANRVNIQSGIVLLMEEEPFAAVVAHELAHYYRSHTTAAHNTGEFNFFYELEESNPNHVPVANPDLQALGDNLQRLNFPSLYYRRVPGQKIASELFKAVQALPQVVNHYQDCGDLECNLECRDFSEWLSREEVKNDLGGFPFRTLSEKQVKTYKELEAKAEACLAKVKLGEETRLDGTELAKELFVEALALDANFRNYYAGLKVEEDVFSSLVAASAQAKATFEKLQEPLKAAKDMHLGFYTTEQEADELGLEWMSDIGVEPARALETEFALGRFVDNLYQMNGIASYPLSLGAEQCVELYQNNWLDENGAYFFVPIADFTDIHHSACYRAFNLDREIKAHGFVANHEADAFVAPTEHSWKELQNAVLEPLLNELLNPTEEEKIQVVTAKVKASLQARVHTHSHAQGREIFEQAKPHNCSFFR